MSIPHVYQANKTFFFVAYEGWRYAEGCWSQLHLTDRCELNGDFTNASIVDQYGSPTTSLTTLYHCRHSGKLHAPTPGGDGLHVPAALIDPTAQAFAKSFSDTPNFTPATPGGPNTILNAWVRTMPTGSADGLTRTSEQTILSGSGIAFSTEPTQPNSEHATGITSADQRNWGGGYTHSFSPTLILDAIAGYSGRFNTVSETKPVGDLSLYSSVQAVYGFVNFGYTGYNGIGGNGPAGSESHEINFAVNMTWIMETINSGLALNSKSRR